MMLLAARLLSLASLLTLLNFVDMNRGMLMVFWVPRVVFSTVFVVRLALMGVAGVLLGLVTRDPFSMVMGAVGITGALVYLRGVTRPHHALDSFIVRDMPPHSLEHRWYWRLPEVKEPKVEVDVEYWRVGDRPLLCDIYRPPSDVRPTGLVYVYCHGSGWRYLDKGELPVFRHLATQGHVVMDVGYRLVPEVGLVEMVGDVKRAIAWIKDNATRYHVNPARVVVAGGSAGGHLALLAAYTPHVKELTPPDVTIDTSVHAVVSMYGIPDLRVFYNQLDEMGRKSSFAIRIAKLLMGLTGMDLSQAPLDKPSRMVSDLVGGTPEEQPDLYRLGSPVEHIHKGCPPTLLIHGAQDVAVRRETIHDFRGRLHGAGLKKVYYIEYPWTDHAFDITGAEISPVAHVALADLEHFLWVIHK